jgi:hypothetical protein
MPHGNPKRLTAFRIDPELLKAVQEMAAVRATNMTAAVEDGLRWWLAREQRKGAKHLAPPTAREVAARNRGSAG